MNLFHKKERPVRPRARVVCGIAVKKQPTLAYIEAVERQSNLLVECVNEIFPGKTPRQMLDEVISLSSEGFFDLLNRAVAAVPRKALEILREIVGAEKQVWEALTPCEHMEVLKAFWELNDLSAFFTSARSVIHLTARAQTRGTGSNG